MFTRNQRYTFQLDVWREEIGPEQAEWRGKVRHLPDGEAYYFRDWATLVEKLEVMLAQPGGAPSQDDMDAELPPSHP